MNTLKQISDVLLQADGKALATSFEDIINVVPVSTVKIVDEKIWLINYFLGKTLHNINNNPNVAFTFWKGFEGYQIKGVVEHLTMGENFDKALKWVAEILPDRTVKGLLILTPLEIFNVSANANHAGKKIL